ncbi:unnamed protein product, partial [Closterium sp. NIES-54]
MFRVSPKPPADQCQSQATVTPSQQFAKGSPKSSARAAVSSCVSLPRLFALLVVLGCAGLWPAFLRNAANHADRGANSGDTVSESSDSLGMPNGFFTVFGGPSAIRGGFSARQLMEMTSEGASRGGGRREGGTMLTWRDDVAIAEGQTEMGEGGKEEGAGESAMAEGEAEGEHAEGGEERANPASPSIAPDAALATAFHAREQGADKAPEALRAASGDEEAAREAEGAERGCGDNPEVVRANVVERVIRWDTCNVTLANLRSNFLTEISFKDPRDEFKGATLFLSRPDKRWKQRVKNYDVFVINS